LQELPLQVGYDMVLLGLRNVAAALAAPATQSLAAAQKETIAIMQGTD